MMVRQAISDGRVGFLRRVERRSNRRRVVAVDARRRPAGGLEPLDLVDGIGKRQRAVDRDAVVVEQHDQLVEFKCPASAIASWLMPSIRSPSEAST